MYPEDVALPIGGEGSPQYIILEMHYDNLNEDSGIRHNHCNINDLEMIV